MQRWIVIGGLCGSFISGSAWAADSGASPSAAYRTRLDASFGVHTPPDGSTDDNQLGGAVALSYDVLPGATYHVYVGAQLDVGVWQTSLTNPYAPTRVFDVPRFALLPQAEFDLRPWSLPLYVYSRIGIGFWLADADGSCHAVNPATADDCDGQHRYNGVHLFSRLGVGLRYQLADRWDLFVEPQLDVLVPVGPQFGGGGGLGVSF
jgi:hypothetical protein